jgi:hypothetical protein
MTTVSLSPIELFQLAGPVGKAVMLILLLASIWCWVLIAEGTVAATRLHAALRRQRRTGHAPLLAPLIEAGRTAHALRIPGEGIADTRHRIMEAMNRQGRIILATTESGLPNLAVLASITPFVGLLGTVWGIMSSFAAIAAAKDTSLAVVAPGIAEALATTAFGLFAAIPASIGFTRIGASVTTAAQDLASLIEEEALATVAPAARLKEAV